MANFGQGQQVHVPIPDWLKKEPNEKRQNAMISYIFIWNLLGYANKDNLPLEEYFDIGTDGWTDDDTNYIIDQFIEHGYIKPNEERFNPNHDGKTGRFTSKGGGGSSGGGSGANGKTTAELVDESTQVVLSRLTNDVQPFKKETEINMKEVKERGNLTDAEAKQCLAIADKVYDKASQKEPQITADVVSSVSGADGEMYGLAFRLKQPSSMAGKIGEDAKEGGVSFSDAGSDIKDAVRYTAVMDSANFTSGYSNIKSSLESKGYTEVRCKNFYQMYDDGKQCQKAVQCVYADPSGYKFELQFHTPKSQGAKELNHPLYEEYRKKTTSDSRKKELYNQMYEYGQYVDNPKGVMSIKSHN